MGQHSPGLVTKLEGRALVLKENRVVTPDEWKDMVHHLVKIFKNEPQTLYPVLAQIYDSDTSTNTNLTKMQILDLLRPYDQNQLGVAQNTSQSKLIKEQIKVVQLNHGIGTRKHFNISLDMNELTNITEEKQQIKNYLTKHFIQINLIITKRILETNTLLEIMHQEKIVVIHPSLITPQELLKHVKDIKVSLPRGTDLPTDLDITNIYELVKLSDIAIYNANDNL
ncbi:Uncharacterized protein FWK35_00036176, partial [Aphis craccivora]